MWICLRRCLASPHLVAPRRKHTRGKDKKQRTFRHHVGLQPREALADGLLAVPRHVAHRVTCPDGQLHLRGAAPPLDNHLYLARPQLA